jgi:hypothetical protein
VRLGPVITFQSAPSVVGTSLSNGGRELPNHPTVSGGNVGGGLGILFGTPFLAAGIFMLKTATHGGPNVHSPLRFDVAFALVFAAVGAVICILGVKNVVDWWTYRRAAAARPHQPWLYDHHWHPEGIAFSALRAMVRRLSIACVVTLFLILVLAVGVGAPGERVFLVVSIPIFAGDAFLWYQWFDAYAEYRRFGSSFLRYGSFPFFLGETLTAGLRVPPHVADLPGLTLTLRCVQQRYVYTPGPKGASRTPVSFELYGHTTSIGRDRLSASENGEISFDFPIPADQPTTCLARAPETYWEIQASGKAEHARYEAYFTVPVYQRDVASA